MGDQYDAPNQQVVRPDGSGPWEEGDGGGAAPQSRKTEEKPETKTSGKSSSKSSKD